MTTFQSDLLERVRQVRERDRKTRTDLLLEMQEALDELDAGFPQGPPERGERGALRYQSLRLRITVLSLRLDVAPAERTPALEVIRGGRDDA